MKAFDIPVHGGLLHAVSDSSGPPVVMLHGGALTHRSWRHQLSDLGKDFHVVAPDARGHGDSSTPTAPFRHADDLSAALEALELGPSVLIGLSMGASTALDVAVERPGLVAGLVLIGAGVGAHPDEFHDPWMHQIFAEWNEALQQQDPALWAEALLKVAVGAGRQDSEVEPALLEELRGMALHTIAHHAGPGMVAPTVSDAARAHLEKLDAPVLAVHGAEDSPDHHRMASEVARAVPNGREVTIPGTAHYPPLEQPHAFNSAVRQWLESIGFG